MAVVLSASAFTIITHAPTGLQAAGAQAAQAQARPGDPMIVAPASTGPMTSMAPNTTRTYSLNWAGYAAGSPRTVFKSMQATFFVPYVDCASTPNSFSSHWIGLDGLASRSVEQLGVEASCSGSRPTYYAWYEMYPKTESAAFRVKPGNAITASISYSSRTKRFSLKLADTTTGQHFRHSLKCAAARCLRSSAEAISEAPAGGSGAILPLANYHASSFSDITIISGRGHRGNLRSKWWHTYEIVQVGGTSHKVAGQPSALSRAKTFTNYWLREN
jgi:hypothetical protein